MKLTRANLARLVRAVTLVLFDRVDCEPRTDAMAPYMEYDASLPQNRNALNGWPVIVEPVNRYTERVWWGPGHHQSYLRYTAAHFRAEDQLLVRSMGAPR